MDFSYGCPMYGFPMDFLWVSLWISLWVSLWISLRISYGFPYGFPIGFPILLDFLWISYGLPYGFPLDSLWVLICVLIFFDMFRDFLKTNLSIFEKK